MPRRSDTREKLLAASARLFRRQGYWGTGLAEVTETGRAPWGSLYHYFPGGKEELGVAAVVHSGAGYQHLIDKVFSEHPDVVSAVRAFFDLMIDALERSDYADGCPIATVTLDVASRSEPLRQACSTVFEAWTSQVAGSFEARYGERAHDLAITALAAFEGAMILSRAHHDTSPLRTARDVIAGLLEHHSAAATDPH